MGFKTYPIALTGSGSCPNPIASSCSEGAVAARALAGQLRWPAAREPAGGKPSRRRRFRPRERVRESEGRERALTEREMGQGLAVTSPASAALPAAALPRR